MPESTKLEKEVGDLNLGWEIPVSSSRLQLHYTLHVYVASYPCYSQFLTEKWASLKKTERSLLGTRLLHIMSCTSLIVCVYISMSPIGMSCLSLVQRRRTMWLLGRRVSTTLWHSWSIKLEGWTYMHMYLLCTQFALPISTVLFSTQNLMCMCVWTQPITLSDSQRTESW